MTLWGKGTMGEKAPATSLVSAAKVPVAATAGTTSGGKAKPGNPTGALAWAVLDEGIKARINTRYVDNAASTGMKTAELGAGERPGAEFISGLNGLERKFFNDKAQESVTIDKGVTRLNFGFAGETLAPGVREALMPLTHDVTTQSLGLFTDTARGGLQQDMQVLMNASTLPADYQGKGVYASRGVSPAGAALSDPKWASLQRVRPALSRHRHQLGRGAAAQGPDAELVGTRRPRRAPPPRSTARRRPACCCCRPSRKSRCSSVWWARPLRLPAAPSAAPTDPARPRTIPWPAGRHFRGTKYHYDLHLLYTPIVTLHNPYNVALEFNNVRVEFVHVPFAMQIFRNGRRKIPAWCRWKRCITRTTKGGSLTRSSG